MADIPRRGWWQFRLASIFWLMLSIGIGIGAYRWGYDAGLADQANQRRSLGAGYPEVYYISDLLSANSTASETADRLMCDLRAQVLPNTWEEQGGGAQIAFFGPAQAFVVSHDHDGHQRVAKYLEKLRSQKKDRLAAAK